MPSQCEKMHRIHAVDSTAYLKCYLFANCFLIFGTRLEESKDALLFHKFAFSLVAQAPKADRLCKLVDFGLRR